MNPLKHPAAWLAGALVLGVLAGRFTAGGGEVVTVRDTIAAEAYERRLNEQADRIAFLTGENGGLKGRVDDLRRAIGDIEAVEPVTITVVDTLIDVQADTVFQPFIEYTDRVVTVEVLVPDTAGHQPEPTTYELPGDCDDCVTLLPNRVVCDGAALGHLTLIAEIGASSPVTALGTPLVQAGAGLAWEPSWRSTTRITATFRTDNRLQIRATIGLHIF